MVVIFIKCKLPCEFVWELLIKAVVPQPFASCPQTLDYGDTVLVLKGPFFPSKKIEGVSSNPREDQWPALALR